MGTDSMGTDPTANENGADPPAVSADGRGIRVGRDASGNAFVTGDHNNVRVVIYQSVVERRETEEAVATEIGPNPYLGLLAFHEEDAGRFFGREEQTARLWETLRDLQQRSAEPSGPPRFLPILGPSGSGKSSLARAGLVPELARRPLPGYRDSSVVVLTPGAHPLEALARVLARIASGDSVPTAKTREFTNELELKNDQGQYDGLRRIADDISALAEVPLFVLVDQFEEIYSLCDDKSQREAFIESLLHVAGDRGGRASVVITLRTDFLGETQTHDALNRLVCEQGIMVPTMTEAELHEAIAKPAERAGHRLDDATVALLTGDAKDREGALPLLQFALARIWDGLSHGVEPAKTYQAIGGLGGALAGEAQRIYDELGEKEKRIARRVFLGLVQLGEGTRDTRRRVRVGDLVSAQEDESEVERVIRRFANRNARLITLSADETRTAETAEVTHEALFEHWQQLNDWLDESREDIRYSRRLEETARSWEEQGRPEGSLWSQSPNIDNLGEFYDRAGSDMSALQTDFYIASHQANQARIAREKRQQNILRGLAAAASAAAVIAIAMFVWAMSSRNSAIQTERIAQEGRIDALVDSILLAPPAEARQRMNALSDATESETLRRYAVQQLRTTLDQPILPDVAWEKYDDAAWDEYDRMNSGKANVVAALLKFHANEVVLPQLRHSPRPDLRSFSIQRFHETGVGPAEVAALLEQADDPSVRRAVILSLGSYPAREIPGDLLRKTASLLLTSFRDDPDSGIHSAAEWALNKWLRESDSRLVDEIDLEPKLKDAVDELARKGPRETHGWFVTPGKQTMVIITPPADGRITIGSPESERGRFPTEDRRPATIPERYAVATTEVTNHQFKAFLSDAKYRDAFGIANFWPDDSRPAYDVSWFMAAAYCNWLTEQEMKDRAKDQLCYHPKLEDGKALFAQGVTVDSGYRQKHGYRLLREAEWEFACRSGADTRYCFGEAEVLLSLYAHYYSRNVQVIPFAVATLRPNDFGLFDMHGNAEEWCHDFSDGYTEEKSSESEVVSVDGVGRVLRGGSFYTVAYFVRSACQSLTRPDRRDLDHGFRVARTYP